MPDKTKTPMLKREELETRNWWVVDADGQILGRLASEVAVLLRGKHKPTFTPTIDMGDCVIVVNADKVAVTGRKLDQKMYYRHSGKLGHLKEVTLRDRLDRHPDRIIRDAVRRMLPKSRLGRKILGNLKVYAGTEHPHEAQKPQAYKVRG